MFDRSGASFGVEKIANTFLFTGQADIGIETGFGSLRVVQDYRGTSFRTSTVASRDDQYALITWSLPVGSGLSTLVRQSWTLSRDSRSLGLSSLERLNGVGGLQWKPDATVDVMALAGAERTTQIGVAATGLILGMDGRVQGLDIDEWTFSSRLLADYHRMDAARSASDVVADASVYRSIDEGSELRVAASYSSVGRAYFTTLAFGSTDLVVEARGEQRVNVDAALTYAVTSAVTMNVGAQLQSASIDRQYAQPTVGVPLTSVNRRLSELVLDLSGELRWALSNMNVTVGGSIYLRDEQNGVSERFAIDASALATLRSQENQRDNATSRTRMQARIVWTPSTRDTLEADITSWLLRYDTPSDLNPDDRDELTTLAAVRYARRVDDGLTIGATLAGQEVHLVFLKAQRSALNNHNRVLRLAPYVLIERGWFTMRPQLEILANYTVYDFEDRGASARSFSFRQIAWRDSLRLRLAPSVHAEGSVLFRYSERATLYWQQFAEAPETGQREWLAKILIFSVPSTTWSIGAGVRRYELVQEPLGTIVAPGATSSLRFWAPEVAVRYGTADGSTLSLSGWYEFQQVNVTGRRDLPNLLLRARVLF